MFKIQTESVNSQKEAYCDDEPTESIRALLLGKDNLAEEGALCVDFKQYPGCVDN